MDGAVRGIAVHLAARVAALAGKGEVFVSSTVKDLAAGSPLESEESASGTSWNVGDPLYLGRRTLRVVAIRNDHADQPPRLVVEEACPGRDSRGQSDPLTPGLPS